jgi:hypothetical protein
MRTADRLQGTSRRQKMDWGAHLRAGTSEYRFVAACMLVSCVPATQELSAYISQVECTHIYAQIHNSLFLYIYIYIRVYSSFFVYKCLCILSS